MAKTTNGNFNQLMDLKRRSPLFFLNFEPPMAEQFANERKKTLGPNTGKC